MLLYQAASTNGFVNEVRKHMLSIFLLYSEVTKCLTQLFIWTKGTFKHHIINYLRISDMGGYSHWLSCTLVPENWSS